MTTVNTILKVIKNGKVEYEQEAKSWLWNFFKLLMGILRDENVSAKEIGGTLVTLQTSGYISKSIGQICLGTDNTSPSFSDYKLKNEVYTASMTYDYVTIENGIKLRFYIQYTPSMAIDIWEIGLKFWLYTTTANALFLMLRDTFSSPSHHEANEAKIYMIEVNIVA
ncbi:MAG: hypothetical protein QXJ14_02525 [Candidatus Aenigmatarchaeota archaeon]